MIASRFRSVWMVGLVAGAALGFYLVSQRVATERAALSRLDRRIAATQKDIRTLSTEIVTRTRMPQLERWNVAVLGLTAPGASQFLDSEVRLAALDGRAAAAVADPANMATESVVRTVSYAPVRSAPASPVAAVPHERPAVADEDDGPAAATPLPLLRQATFVRPKAGAMSDPAPIKVALKRPAKPVAALESLLPEDIGALAAEERGTTRSRR